MGTKAKWRAVGKCFMRSMKGKTEIVHDGVKFEDAGAGSQRGLPLARVLKHHRFEVMLKVTVITGSNPVVSTIFE